MLPSSTTKSVIHRPIRLSAYRLTNRPTAAIIHLLHTISHLLTTNPYVAVISFDFSKANDTVRHSRLLEKLASLELPDEVYNWLVNFFEGHCHCTKFEQHTSPTADITAIDVGTYLCVRGTARAAYVVNTSDLNAIAPGNALVKFANDTYIVVPVSNIHTRQVEIDSVEQWTRTNNLKVKPPKIRRDIVRAGLRYVGALG